MNNALNCEDFRDDLEMFALHALDPDDAARVRMHLHECAACTEVVFSYQRTVEELALLTPIYRAPARLKGRIMGGIGASGAGRVASVLRSGWVGNVAAVLLICFAIGAVAWAMRVQSDFTEFQNEVTRLQADNERLALVSELDAGQRDALLEGLVGLQGDLNSAKTEQERLETTLQEQATLIQVALDPDLVPTELLGTAFAPGANCSYVWSTKQEVGALTCKDLPAISFDTNYELWVLQGDDLIPVATFDPALDGTAQVLVKMPPEVEDEALDDLWVTLERASNVYRYEPQGARILITVPEQQAAR